ncbi:hypothetical protein PAMP_019060 [Pampus punctatissimus]
MAPVLQMFTVIFASALLQTATSAHHNDTIFAVTVSSQVEGGKQETLCAQIHNPTESVSLIIDLKIKTDSDRTVILKETVEQDFYRCVTFQVPTVRDRTVATIDVSIQGDNTNITKKTKVLIKPPAFIHIIQTDKPIYKPGQTVQFRIVSMDANFISVDRVYTEVALQDPSLNRIAQWLDKSIAGGILDLSHLIIPEAEQGTYMITATTDKEEKISHSFDIKEYVLPKYTYGKPVLGSVKAVCCRPYRYYWFSTDLHNDLCETYEMQTDRSGCATQTVNMTAFSLNKNKYDDTFEVQAEMEEYGTGVILKGSGRTSLSNHIRTVTFKDVPATYKPGIPFEGKVKMVGPDKRPAANEHVYMFIQNLHNLTLTTDMKGIASFSLDTSLWKDTVFLMARSREKEEHEPYVANIRRPEYTTAYHHVDMFYSKSSSFLKLMQVSGNIACDKDATVRAQYIIQGEELKKGQEVLNFFYLVISRGGIVQHGRIPVDVKAGTVNKGELSISLHQVTNLAPFAQVVVYTVMPSGEAVADSQDFPIQLCLNNKVSLKFSSLQELPAEKTTLKLQAHPGSLCSVRAIDQSVLLLQSEQELTVDYVYNQLPLQKLSGYPYDVEDFEPYPCLIVEPPMDAASIEDSHFFVPPTHKSDVYSIFKEIGIKIVTNSDVKKPYDCRQRMFDVYYYDVPDTAAAPMPFNMMPSGSAGVRDEEEEKKETVRTFFPETWIWDLVTVGDSGSVNVEKTVPDTITKWAAGAFCISSVGFGVSPNTGLTAFQPFFVSLTLPYSVIRGEVFTLKATVFNYLSSCIMVKVTLADSDQYTFRSCDGCQYSEVTLKVSAEALKTDIPCGNEIVTVPDVGRIDTVVRTLLVQAEGTPQSVSHNALLCPTDGPVEKNISLLMPEVFVAGSARATVSVLGYQRELNYKHDDGSYSAFGKSDNSGNTWLTSFVMKSFAGATPYIFVDSEHIEQAKKWLLRHQRPDGCITSVGKLLHNGMKGGVSDNVSLTAYITAALLELNATAKDPMVQNCLNCLRAAVAGQMDNLYTTALLSYTFTLAGDQEMRSKLITYLHQKSNTQGTTDTVVALQALAKYGAATYSEEGSTTVTVTSSGGLKKEFKVDQMTRLLYQEEKLSDIPGEYTITAQGQSCVQAQISMHYNVPPPPDFSAFNISTLSLAKCNTSRPQIILFVRVRYQGRREETNMVIINIKLLSGYILDKSSLKLVNNVIYT